MRVCKSVHNKSVFGQQLTALSRYERASRVVPCSRKAMPPRRYSASGFSGRLLGSSLRVCGDAGVYLRLSMEFLAHIYPHVVRALQLSVLVHRALCCFEVAPWRVTASFCAHACSVRASCRIIYQLMLSMEASAATKARASASLLPGWCRRLCASCAISCWAGTIRASIPRCAEEVVLCCGRCLLLGPSKCWLMVCARPCC